MYIRITGAINTETGLYTPPFLANKANKYKCFLCSEKVKLNEGEIKGKYFSHIIKFNCNCFAKQRYREPYKIIISEIDELEKQKKENESEYHKEGKKLIKALLEDGYKLSFIRYCETLSPKCSKKLLIRPNMICDNSKIEIEYHMKHNNKSIYCDIAHLVNGEVNMIYEIFYKHRTADNNRPNNINWVDIKVKDIYEKIENKKDKNDKTLLLTCSRFYECEECKQYNIEIMQKEKERLRKQMELEIQEKLKREKANEERKQEIERLKKKMQEEKEKQIQLEKEQEEKVKKIIQLLEKYEPQIREKLKNKNI